jgi:peroxiredoxin
MTTAICNASRPASAGLAKSWKYRFLSVFTIAICLMTGGLSSAYADSGAKPAPRFVLPSLHGEPVRLDDFRGRYVLLNFWATWCGPCKMEMPSLENLNRKFPASKLSVVGVSNDMFGATVVKPYVESQGLTFPILLDPGSDVSNSFHVLSLPSTYLIDPDGNIIGEQSGAENWSAPETLQYFEDLLKQR